MQSEARRSRPLLPHSRSAEASILGSILIRGEDALRDAQALLKPEDFYVPAYQSIFRAMAVLSDRGQPTDIITIEAQLRSQGELELVGGIEGLSRLTDEVAITKNVEAHAEVVLRNAQVRNWVITARQIADDGMGEIPDVREFLDTAESKIRLLSESGRRTTMKSAKEVTEEVFAKLADRAKRKEAITGVPTGFIKLDSMTAGLQPSDLLIIAARPSMGKTAFTLNLAQNACIPRARDQLMPEEERPKRFPVLFFSLEMSADSLVERILCAEARMDASKLRKGDLIESDFRDLIEAADRVASSKLYIDDTAAPSIMEIRARARKWRDDPSIFPPQEEGEQPALGMIIIDYLQLARGSKANQPREQEISEISRGLKGIAKELKVPVIALSQLNRAVDSRADHRPMMSDLRESGAIEQDADVIMFIFRAERYLTAEASEEERRQVENKAEIIIGKQRNGPIGTVHLNFISRYTRFENPANEDFAPEHG